MVFVHLLQLMQKFFPTSTVFQCLPAPHHQLGVFITKDTFWYISHDACFGGQAGLLEAGFPSGRVSSCKPVMVSC